jgi:hypothetical protein
MKIKFVDEYDEIDTHRQDTIDYIIEIEISKW